MSLSRSGWQHHIEILDSWPAGRASRSRRYSRWVILKSFVAVRLYSMLDNIESEILLHLPNLRWMCRLHQAKSE